MNKNNVNALWDALVLMTNDFVIADGNGSLGLSDSKAKRVSDILSEMTDLVIELSEMEEEK